MKQDTPAHSPMQSRKWSYLFSLTLPKSWSNAFFSFVFTFHEDCIEDIEAGEMTIQETMVFPINHFCLGHHIRDQALHICLWGKMKLWRPTRKMKETIWEPAREAASPQGSVNVKHKLQRIYAKTWNFWYPRKILRSRRDKQLDWEKQIRQIRGQTRMNVGGVVRLEKAALRDNLSSRLKPERWNPGKQQ